ncbi:MAG: type II secretion system F family protein [Aeromicrobium sp.]
MRAADVAIGWCLGAAIATTAACYVARPDDWVVIRLRLGSTTSNRVSQLSARARMAVAVVGTIAVSLALPDLPTQVAVVAGVAVGLFSASLRRQARARRAAAEFRADIARVLNSVSAELRAGVEPLAAVRAAVADEAAAWSPVRSPDAADMVEALRTVSARPGGESLAEVAAAWQIADQTGSPLANVLDRMAAAVRAEVELDREVAVEAAPARATGRLMALLPLAGLGLGMMLGVNPIRVLLTTGIGVTCLVAGLGLAGLGVWQIERIVSSVEAR